MPAALVFLLPVLLAAGPPRPPDRADPLSYRDDRGERRAVRTPADWPKRVAQIHAGMEAVMGPLPPPTDLPLDVRVTGETSLRLYTRRHLTFVAEKGDRLPAYLLVPHGGAGKHPAVVCLPGSSSPGKDVPAGLTPDLDRAYAHELAERGYVCLVLDYPVRHTREYATDPAALGYVSTTMKGVVNHRRGVDLLRALPFVDGDAIGVIGHSLGGHNALFLAAFDPRVRAVVSSCGFNTFAKYMRGNLAGWSSKYYMPRIKTVYGDDPARMPFDFPEVLAAIAPRPVFVNAPRHDDNFEVSGVRECIAAALPVYRLFGAADRLQVEYPDAGHTFPVAQRIAAYDFLDRHLRPSSAAAAPPPAAGDFTVALEVDIPVSPEVPMDLVSRYDPARRRGFHLTLKTATGVTSNQPNRRHLQFGIDADRASAWEDCGRPGAALFAFGLATHEGYLYAGTCEPGKDERGHVYRYAGGRTWIDCGAPDRCNAVTALGSHDGRLYAGTGRYRLAGSALAESENRHLGGRIFRYEGGTRWTDCGQLPDTEAIGGLVVFAGRLYASSLYPPAGFYRYDGEKKWTSIGVPGGKRVEPLAVHGDALYAGSYDGGHVYRFDGRGWTDLGRLGDNTQTYSFASYRGRLHVGTWPSGRVYRLDSGDRWTDTGRLGEELEVMGMTVHNGRLLAGTLPRAEVYEYETDGKWRLRERLDRTPDVKYRRAWTMAEHAGRVFCATLPSGRVFAFAAGVSVSWDHELPAGRHHVTAVRRGDRLELSVDGRLVARSVAFAPADYPVDVNAPLRIGDGWNGPVRGTLRDVRVLRRALTPAEIRALADPAKR